MSYKKPRLAPGKADRLWFLIQLGALSVAVVTPIFVKSRSNPTIATEVRPQENDHSLVSVTKLAQVKKTEGRESLIRSEVLLLPDPFSIDPENYKGVFQVGTRQLRFERVARMAPVVSQQRAPSSLKLSQKEWVLTRIERKAPNRRAWEDISLIRGGEKSDPLGSIYFELFEGTNDFKVHYKNSKGQLKTYALKIKHSR